MEARLQSKVNTEVLSMFWGLDCLCEFQIIHNVLEMVSEYLSMNAVIDHDSVSSRMSDRKLTARPNQHDL